MSKRPGEIGAGAGKLPVDSIHAIQPAMGPDQQHARPRQELEELALKLHRENGAMNRRWMENRAAATPEFLAQYMDRWVAWSPDGTRVVAHSENIEDLDALVADAGELPNKCPVEYLSSI